MLTTIVFVTLGATFLMAIAFALLLDRGDALARERLEDARAVKAPPPNLRPVVDPDVCIGSAACVDACPEEVLVEVDGLPHMVDPGSCVGHGACRDACPVGAISLVFGSAERGVDLPVLRPDFQSTVEGIYVAGELGGMGLIRNAFRQGLGAVASIDAALGNRRRSRRDDAVDLLVVGAGPAGIACALQASELGLTCRVLEQWAVGGSVTHYPRRKVVMTEPCELPIVGRFGRREMSKEELVEGLTGALRASNAEVLEGRRVTGVTGRAGGFRVAVERAGAGLETHSARALVLAIGRRGTPRKLGVPGEESSHVVYSLLDAAQHRGRRVLVVGGGDSAVEAALALSEVARCEVALSYRGESFSRIKRKNRDRLEAAAAARRIALHLRTQVARIHRDAVVLEGPDGAYRLPAEDVIVSVGAELPLGFLSSLGVGVEQKHGEELAHPDASTRAQALIRASRRLSQRLLPGRLAG